MFQNCDFLFGSGDTLVIVIPAMLPLAETYTISVTNEEIKFKAGYDEIASFGYQGGEIFQRIAQHTQIGLVEYPGDSDFPNHITNVAYVEVRRVN